MAKGGDFTRRRFIASIPIGTLLFAVADPVSSFGQVIKKGNTSNGSDLLFYIDSNGQKKPVTSLAEWKIKQEQILERLQNAMGKLPKASGLPAPDVRIIEQIKEDNYTRLTIRFTATAKESVPAYLYIPASKSGKKTFPAMLALHETDSIGKKSVDGQGHNPNLGYAKELAQRGYIVIAPDYPGFGDVEDYDFKTDRYQSGTMKSIFDNKRCIDLLESRPDVDANRIGVIGHSLGGHTALFTGAFDTRLKVIVSSCGWTLLDYYNVGEKTANAYGGRLGPWAQERYMPLLRSKYNLDGKRMPFDFDEVLAAIAPRGIFSNSPVNDGNFDVNGVKKGIAEVSDVYRFLGAEDQLQVSYPESAHDFPPAVRMEAYRFIDKTLGVTSTGKI